MGAGTALVLVSTGCGARPDVNAPIRVTGDRDAAIPPTSSTSTTEVPEPTTTTLFYAQPGN